MIRCKCGAEFWTAQDLRTHKEGDDCPHRPNTIAEIRREVRLYHFGKRGDSSRRITYDKFLEFLDRAERGELPRIEKPLADDDQG